MNWIAPRDNRDVYVYDIRFDTKPITEKTWEYSIPIGYWATPKPRRPGSAEETSVNMPDPATEYYFAIRSADAAGNWSDLTTLSSSVKSRTPGTTPSSPSVECATTVPDDFSSIQAAANYVAITNFGGNVCVRPGIYVESKLKLKDGVYLVALSNDPAETIIDGDGKGDVISFRNVRMGGVVGFTLRNSKKNGNAAAINIIGAKQMPLIARNIISNNLYGIRLQGYVRPLIINNTIVDNSRDGIRAGVINPALVLNNIVVGNQDNGIVTFSNNIFNFLKIWESWRGWFKKGSHRWGRWAGLGQSLITLAHNDVYGNKDKNYVGLEPGEGSISLDPRFTDGHRLATDFPCIDAGLSLDGTATDMGAYGSSTVELLNTATTALFTDTDGDGIDDTWELLYFNNLTIANQNSDYDQDGYSDVQEYLNNQNHAVDPEGVSFDLSAANAAGGTGYEEIVQQERIINRGLGAILHFLLGSEEESGEPETVQP